MAKLRKLEGITTLLPSKEERKKIRSQVRYLSSEISRFEGPGSS